MILVNIKREITLPSGETKKVRETYLSCEETCSEATIHIMENVPGAEILSTKKAKFYDVVGDGPYYTARVSMVIFDGEKEKTKNVHVLVSGEDYRDAVKNLYSFLSTHDARVISLGETKIAEYIR